MAPESVERIRIMKFMGKRAKGGEWVSGSLTKYLSGKEFKYFISAQYYEPGNEHWFIHEVTPESVGQYIGVTDLNSDYICEGHVVREMFTVGKDVVGVVIYEKKACAFRIKWTDEKGGIQYSELTATKSGINYFNNDNIVIEGNIIDNPDLLK